MTTNPPIPHPAELLPHGKGFLFVDKIISLEGRAITATRNVPIDEPWTTSHFPGNEIVPGVLILEGMVQVCAILARVLDRSTSSPERERCRVGMLASVKTARFRRAVRPGALLIYHAEMGIKAGTLYSFDSTTSVDGYNVADAQICLSIR